MIDKSFAKSESLTFMDRAWWERNYWLTNTQNSGSRLKCLQFYYSLCLVPLSWIVSLRLQELLQFSKWKIQVEGTFHIQITPYSGKHHQDRGLSQCTRPPSPVITEHILIKISKTSAGCLSSHCVTLTFTYQSVFTAVIFCIVCHPDRSVSIVIDQVIVA